MTAAAREVELKFLCRPEDLDRVLAAAPGGDDETRRLVSTYFDTDRGDLRKAGVSLRIREQNGHRVQTLKRGEGVRREEHEEPVQASAPDISLGPLHELLADKPDRRLKPAFRVEVQRRQRLIREGDAEIELAADLGEVRNGRIAAQVCEVELELKSGPPPAMFALARRLGLAAPLYLSFEGKASQGQALLDGTALAARHKSTLRLSRDATVAAAFQALAHDCIAQIAANAAVLRQVDEPEAIHQLRVAARRLRSALSTFEPAIAEIERGYGFRDELKWLARSCDQARNLDVYAAETLRPALAADSFPRGLDRLAESVELARTAAHGAVVETVSSMRFRALLLELAAWIETGDWLQAPAAQRPARAFAAEALDRQRRKLLKRGFDLRALGDHERHKVRIQAKRLRYAVEGFAPLFDAKDVSRFVDRLKPVQDRLGDLNDIATAEGLVAGLGLDAEAAFAGGHLAGERASGRGKLIARAARALRKLSKVSPFWRD
jgi:inorganic triphosphatase YgiF